MSIEHSTVLYALTVRPTFGHHLTWTTILLIAGWLFCQKLAAMQTDDLEKLLGVAVLDALRFARLSVKEACALMGVDYFNFQAALKGEAGRRIALAPLLRLPLTFWVALLPELTYLATKQRVQDIAEELSHVRRVS